jgi:hypothetical protein
MMMSALPIATVKYEPSFKYQATRLLVTEPLCASLEWTSMTPYKLDMALQMPSPINRSLRREEDHDDDFQGRRQQSQVCSRQRRRGGGGGATKEAKDDR